MRKLIASLLVIASLALAGCSSMSTQQKQEIRADVLTGLEIVAAGVAVMPGVDPVTRYWSEYAAGVLEKSVR